MASYDAARTICQSLVSYMASYDAASTICKSPVGYMASYDAASNICRALGCGNSVYQHSLDGGDAQGRPV